jgi:hypothetical protein
MIANNNLSSITPVAIVPAGTINRYRRQCTKLRGDYLFTAFALAKVFRARFIKGMIERATFGYVDGKSNRYKTRTVPGETFLWLVYQHLLPKGFRRIRDYGYLNGNAKDILAGIQRALGVMVAKLPELIRPAFRCGGCGGELRAVAFMKPARPSG